MAKKALITGVTGQDGSYLAEFLLEKGYEVHGLKKRSASFNEERISHIKSDKFFLHYADLTDGGNLLRVIKEITPDEIYNLAAQSHVAISWDIPEYTINTDGLGVVRILEIIRALGLSKKTKFYQASTSELFSGKLGEAPQNEETILQPQTPYALGKLLGFWAVRVYRKAFGIFACNGILFNHETIAFFTPMFCKNISEKEFDIKPISEVVGFDETQKNYQSKKVSGIQVWGKKGWVDVTFASAYPHDIKKDNKHPRFVNARSGAFMATGSHIVFMNNGKEKKTNDIEAGDRLENITLPPLIKKPCVVLCEEEAELMGMLVGDGSITHAKKGIGVHAKFTNSSEAVRSHFTFLWKKVTGGCTTYYASKSGFNPLKTVGQLMLTGGSDWLRKLDIYTKQPRQKRVPKVILNSPPNIMLAFLKGYNMADGLKQNRCTYEFRNFKTNSATLAMGLWYLIDKTTKQDINLTLEIKDDGRIFYSLNLLSTIDNQIKEDKVRGLMTKNISQRGIARQTKISRSFIRKIQRGGFCCTVHHLRKDSLEVKKIIDFPGYDGWFYDLETSSGEFHCGVGRCHVHNSPRRGENFVTRKITLAAARVSLGLQEKLFLGNLNAKRDWGHAKDYVEMMWLMLQQKEPEDYIISSGKSRSVRDFCEIAFGKIGIDLEWQGEGVDEKGVDKKTNKVVVAVDPQFFRPSEVESLEGNPSKAKEKLGWEPKITFEQLVEEMVSSELQDAEKEIALKKQGL